MTKVAMIVLAGLAASAAPAADRAGYQAIAAGDWVRATQRLEAERRIHPRRPEVMLNLAAAYRRTGREADARALYQAVLTRPAAAMDLPSGDVASSHDLASRGATELAAQVAAR